MTQECFHVGIAFSLGLAAISFFFPPVCRPFVFQACLASPPRRLIHAPSEKCHLYSNPGSFFSHPCRFQLQISHEPLCCLFIRPRSDPPLSLTPTCLEPAPGRVIRASYPSIQTTDGKHLLIIAGVLMRSLELASEADGSGEEAFLRITPREGASGHVTSLYVRPMVATWKYRILTAAGLCCALVSKHPPRWR